MSNKSRRNNAAIKSPQTLATPEELEINNPNDPSEDEEEETETIDEEETDGEEEEEETDMSDNSPSIDDLQPEEETQTPDPSIQRAVTPGIDPNSTPDEELPPEAPEPAPEVPFISHKNIQQVHGEHVVHCRNRTYSFGGQHYGPGLVEVIDANGDPLMWNDNGKETPIAETLRKAIDRTEKPVAPRKPGRPVINRPIDPLQIQADGPLFGAAPRDE